ncbi:BRCT domain-containing protein [Corynebacterium sputi]|uniref:BRCT domain-containing protein n=1 Tax=Corynebacterium sputi TaxID=489915 RepID=UPI0004284235|nr:BRCT domain-containing protein [Corynebacterium sputi]
MTDSTDNRSTPVEDEVGVELETSGSEFPYVAAVVRASGIHPKSSRMVSLGLRTFDADGTTGQTWHSTFTIGEDPGPVHLHGLTPEDLNGSPRYGTKLNEVSAILEGRTVITHDSPMTWGFIIEEAKRARRWANRANRNRRGHSGSRIRVGRVPAPETVVDTLATARRQRQILDDRRLFAVASLYDVSAPSPIASIDNADLRESDRTLEATNVLKDLFLAQSAADEATVMSWTNEDLRADSLGLQRSSVRVDAIEAPHPEKNPGKYKPGKSLATGMVFCVAPELEFSPDEIIAAGVAAGLTYTESVTRDASILVCNRPVDVPVEALTGKAMHAERKGIPLVSDSAFLRLTEDLRNKA